MIQHRECAKGKDNVGADIDILGATSEFEGSAEIEGDLRVDGRFKGELRCRRLVLAPGGTFEGKARVGDILIEGKFTGEIVAEGLVTLRRGAAVRADILYNRLSVEEGALFDGKMSSFEGRDTAVSPGTAIQRYSDGQLYPP